MKKIMFLILTVVIAFGSVTLVSQAQVAQDLDDDLVGVTITEPSSLPSGFGLWWQGLKERVSLIFTFDPLKKAEKRLVYAEQKLQLAEYMANNDQSDKSQDRSIKIMEQVDDHLTHIESLKDRWIDADDDRVKNLVRNVATHQIRREKVMDKVEGTLSQDNLSYLQAIREGSLENGDRLVNALMNEDIPQDVLGQLAEIKLMVENHLSEVKMFNQQRRELMDDVRDGDEEAVDDLRQLQQQRQEAVKNRVDNWRQIKMNQSDDDYLSDEDLQQALNGDDGDDLWKEVMNGNPEAAQKMQEQSRSKQQSQTSGPGRVENVLVE